MRDPAVLAEYRAIVLAASKVYWADPSPENEAMYDVEMRRANAVVDAAIACGRWPGERWLRPTTGI
jgi:hypothetical protein